MKILYIVGVVFMSNFFQLHFVQAMDVTPPQLLSIERVGDENIFSTYDRDREGAPDYQVSLVYRYTFSEDVVNFEDGKVGFFLSGTAGSGVAQVGQSTKMITQISPSVYELTVMTNPQDGTISYSIYSSTITDIAGNPLTAGSPSEQEFYTMAVYPDVKYPTFSPENIGEVVTFEIEDDYFIDPEGVSVDTVNTDAHIKDFSCDQPGRASNLTCTVTFLSTGKIMLNVADRAGNQSIYPASLEAPLYRFWSENYKHHFFTSSEDEKDSIIANDPNWAYESVAYNVEIGSRSGSVPIYRFYSSLYQGHFFTMSSSEKDSIIANDPNWNYEGVAYHAFEESDSDRKSVYRFWSDNFKGHFYTASEQEKDSLIANDPNWNYEGVAWYYEG